METKEYILFALLFLMVLFAFISGANAAFQNGYKAVVFGFAAFFCYGLFLIIVRD